MRANLPSSSLDMNTYSVSNYGDRDVRAGAKARKGDRHDRPNLSSFFGCDAAELVGGSQEPAVAHAPPLTRATGIRLGECIDLALDCLRQIGPHQWALHVPLGLWSSETALTRPTQPVRLSHRPSPHCTAPRAALLLRHVPICLSDRSLPLRDGSGSRFASMARAQSRRKIHRNRPAPAMARRRTAPRLEGTGPR